MWKPYRNRATIGGRGSESGEIILDEEYDDSCRITLEKCEGHYAITCGIYGAMVHTAFCGEKDFAKMYEAMKNNLATFIK